MKKVSVRGGFSDRNGIKAENTEIQIINFDEKTRIQLFNTIMRLYDIVYEHNLYYKKRHIQQFLKFVLCEIYSEAIDVRMIYFDDDVIEAIKETFLHGEYDDILTLVEGLINYWDRVLRENRGSQYYITLGWSIYEVVNDFFEREYIGYRFIDEKIVPISDPYEVAAIKDTLSIEYESVYEHISKANKVLSDRENPDYENSIKESISAVEAMCQIIIDPNGNEATLGNMLKKLENNGIAIHGALKSAFEKLYGYTSDANGIRHAGDIGGPSSTFEEAKFMLVSCCAFINYLIAVNAD